MPSRHFEYKDAKSDKFWEISLDGPRFTVRWGRRGSEGQSKTKELGSDGAARQAHDKLVAEKLREGYTEGAAGAPSAGTSAPPPVRPPARAAAVTGGQGTSRPVAFGTSRPTTEPAGAVATGTEPAPPAAVPELPPCSIDLDPDDWRWATWRTIPPVAVQPPAPFDREACLERLRAALAPAGSWAGPDWVKAGIPLSMSRDEAQSWLQALLVVGGAGRGEAQQEALENLRDAPLSGVSVEALQTAADQQRGVGLRADEIVLPLLHLLDPAELRRVLLLQHKGWGGPTGVAAFTRGFRRFVLPRLGPSETDQWKRDLEPILDPTRWPQDYYCVPTPFLLAAALGMHAALLRVVEGWPDDAYTKEEWHDAYHQPQAVVFGLADPGLVQHHMRRLRLRLKTPDHVRAWLAHTETSALDDVASSVVAAQSKELSETLARVLALVRSPKAAPALLRVYVGSKAPWVAKEWMDENPAFTVAGLVPLVTQPGGIGAAALDVLRTAFARGQAGLLTRALEGQTDAVRARVRSEVLENRELTATPLDAGSTPAWLGERLPAPPKKEVAPWLSVQDLPPLLIGDRRLNDGQVAALLAALRLPNAATRDLAAALQAHAEPASREEFAWKLFELWLAAGAPSKDKWAFQALGQLGGDRAALRLAPLVREWPGQAQHARAVKGLDVLRAIGTDGALMQLSGIAQKVPFKALKQRANECMEAIAAEKGLTKAELEDRVVPDCGLDPRGRRVFDFGPRQFVFALGPELKPMLRDDEGRLRDDLPKPGAKDDASKALAAVEEWKLLKKQIREAAKIHVARLEQAMVTGRVWKRSDFESLIVNHPLLTHIARRLLWCGLDAERRLLGLFRVTDERDYADGGDAPLSLEGFLLVGLVHPLRLSSEEAECWGRVFGEYEILAPFTQLGRVVHRLEPGEEKQDRLARFEGLKLPAPSLVFTLEKLGWSRGEAMDAGCFCEHSKQYPGGSVTAVIAYDGTVGMGYIDASETLTVSNVHFVRGLRPPEGYEGASEKGMRLGDVDPVVLSEVMHDLAVLREKAGAP
jgi:predicted DNA-binding WGR domain protein